MSTVHITSVTTRDQKHLSPLLKESLCWSHLLDDTFVANYAANEADAAAGIPNTVDLQHFGHEATGLWRDFPGPPLLAGPFWFGVRDCACDDV